MKVELRRENCHRFKYGEKAWQPKVREIQEIFQFASTNEIQQVSTLLNKVMAVPEAELALQPVVSWIVS